MNDNVSIGVKIHDVHHGLVDRVGAIIESEYSFLKETGAALQLATVIKDHEIINDLKTFYAAAGELKITRQLADVGLAHLEKLGFVRIKYRTGRQVIDRIDIVVPDLPRLYHDFGEYFNSENDSNLATSTLKILEKLSAFPHKEKEIISELGISPTDRDIILDVGKGASIIDTYISPTDSESIMFSPLYWDDNPMAIFTLLKKHESAEFLKTVEKIRDYQGLPDGRVNEDILADAIRLGCLPTLSVSSTRGLKKFIFTPRKGVGAIEKDLLHKARVLISCVRYGENFAGITQIFNPEKLISVLAKRGYLNAHSESLKQYEPARNLGLVKIIPSHSNRYEVHFIDNEENKMVVSMALDMIQIGEISKFDETENFAKQRLIPGNILHPTQTRTHLLNEKVIENTTSTAQRVNDILRGIE